jgi:hypothetical protein
MSVFLYVAISGTELGNENVTGAISANSVRFRDEAAQVSHVPTPWV